MLVSTFHHPVTNRPISHVSFTRKRPRVRPPLWSWISMISKLYQLRIIQLFLVSSKSIPFVLLLYADAILHGLQDYWEQFLPATKVCLYLVVAADIFAHEALADDLPSTQTIDSSLLRVQETWLIGRLVIGWWTVETSILSGVATPRQVIVACCTLLGQFWRYGLATNLIMYDDLLKQASKWT